MAAVINNIKIEQLHPHPDNPRKDVGDVTELAESIKINGIMQNLTVIPMFNSDHDFIVLIGHRRLAAAKKAGLKKLPCKVILTDIPTREEQIAIMLEENMQRQDLTVIEQAKSFRQVKELGGSLDTLRTKTGFSETTIRNRLKIAELNEELVGVRTSKESAWQMTIEDMVELTKLDDEDIRNNLMKESYSREQFRYRLQSALHEQEKEEALQPFLQRVSELNIPSKKNVYSYTPGYELITSFKYSDPALLSYTPNSEEFYVINNDQVQFFRKEDKKESTPEDEEKKVKEAEEKKQKAEYFEKCEKLKKKLIECITMICQDRIKINMHMTNYESFIRELWQCIFNLGCSVGPSSSTYIFLPCRDYWRSSTDDREDAKKKFEALSTEKQMLAHLAYCVSRFDTMTSYPPRKYNKDKASHWLRVVNLLYAAGFEPTDDEIMLMSGTDDYYEKEEKDV